MNRFKLNIYRKNHEDNLTYFVSLQTNRTPLHFVLSEKNGDDELIQMLLTYGANTNLGDSVSYFFLSC